MLSKYADSNIFNLLYCVKVISGKHERPAYGYEIESVMLSSITHRKLKGTMKSAQRTGLIARTERNPLYHDRFKLTGRGKVILKNAENLYTLYGLMIGEERRVL